MPSIKMNILWIRMIMSTKVCKSLDNRAVSYQGKDDTRNQRILGLKNDRGVTEISSILGCIWSLGNEVNYSYNPISQTLETQSLKKCLRMYLLD
jgi:hypothetical protein